MKADKKSTPEKRVRPGIWIPRPLWAKIRIMAFNEGVKAEVVAERLIEGGLKKEEPE